MPKAKPISLHPLCFHEALKALVNVDPEKVGITTQHRKKHKKKQQRTAKKVHGIKTSESETTTHR